MLSIILILSDRFKLALLNLERLDIEGEDLEVPIGGYIEPCFNQDQDWQLWGTLGWIQDWFVRPVQKKKKYKQRSDRLTT